MERRTGRFASFAVAFAFVSIATGIFTTYGAVLNSSGPMGIWTWPIAVVGQLAVAFVLGSLAVADPGDRLRATSGCRGWPTRCWAGSSAGSRSRSWPSWWSRSTTRSPRRCFPVLLNYEGTATIAWLVTALVLLLQALLVAFSTKWSRAGQQHRGRLAELIGMVA